MFTCDTMCTCRRRPGPNTSCAAGIGDLDDVDEGPQRSLWKQKQQVFLHSSDQ